MKRNFFPLLFVLLAILAFFFNLLGFMKLVPVFITLPLLLASIYCMLSSIAYQNTKGYRR
ncbi:hypothetical protein [Oceanobacillus sp. J11TS1]|uniref:hypothetical protein n=1 Tax=Oceanobacillus sp. J11TS1 TaxID=2807191 RepID=UPI001B1EE956|nr:hypothetical protein [Oceanobacillus sp. J11TS1]GIO24415.1 hypothetical protein J11TS1_29960 [Oceanobacillus sp. J11TS1]